MKEKHPSVSSCTKANDCCLIKFSKERKKKKKRRGIRREAAHRGEQPPLPQLFPISGHSISITRVSQCLFKPRYNTGRMRRAMSVYCSHKETKRCYSLINSLIHIPTAEGAHRDRQQIIHWNWTHCVPQTLRCNPNVFTPFTNIVYCRSHSLECSWVNFSLSPSPLCNYNVRWHSAGGGREEEKKEGKGWWVDVPIPAYRLLYLHGFGLPS